MVVFRMVMGRAVKTHGFWRGIKNPAGLCAMPGQGKLDQKKNALWPKSSGGFHDRGQFF
ncbi:hypothetical protein AA19596_0480 [Acetobacter fabarum DSM 19596]|nr:hypothetical protein AA19596_0480 [Acetobacter fabarum DSM 19596]